MCLTFFYSANIFLTRVYMQSEVQVNTFFEMAVFISHLFLKLH